jgi:hypothetical protein
VRPGQRPGEALAVERRDEHRGDERADLGLRAGHGQPAHRVVEPVPRADDVGQVVPQRPDLGAAEHQRREPQRHEQQRNQRHGRVERQPGGRERDVVAPQVGQHVDDEPAYEAQPTPPLGLRHLEPIPVQKPVSPLGVSRIP